MFCIYFGASERWKEAILPSSTSQTGGRKAQQCLKRKKRHPCTERGAVLLNAEREREAAKAAKLPTHQRQCETCGRKFESRKTAKKAQVPQFQSGTCTPREAARRTGASQAIPVARSRTSPLPHPPHTPPLTHHKLGVNAQAGQTTIPYPQ